MTPEERRTVAKVTAKLVGITVGARVKLNDRNPIAEEDGKQGVVTKVLYYMVEVRLDGEVGLTRYPARWLDPI